MAAFTSRRKGYERAFRKKVNDLSLEISVVRFESGGEEKTKGNQYVEFIPPLRNTEEAGPPVIITGFGEGRDLYEQLQAVRLSDAAVKYLIMSQKTMDSPVMLDFLAEEKHGVIRLPKPESDYYIKVLYKCLENTGFKKFSEEEASYVVSSLMQLFGTRFSEKHIVQRCSEAIKKACSAKRRCFLVSDFLGHDRETSVLEQINDMVGLGSFKKILPRICALNKAALSNAKLKDFHTNMIFYGNPGTGKTTGARLIAGAIREMGAGTGVLIEADRASLIGEYVGHTAPKIKKKFDDARGGVLFIDEADFLLTEDHNRGYTGEAVKELVRFMENYPDVTVIFAMYENKVKSFLELDEGLRSRIRTLVHFEDYDPEELVEITEYMLKNYSYVLSKGAREVIKGFFDETDMSLANARGARKLVEELITTHSLETVALSLNEKTLKEQGKIAINSSKHEKLYTISKKCAEESIREMLEKEPCDESDKRIIGFINN